MSIDPLSIFAVDGDRSRARSGYGMLARSLILGLVARGHDVRMKTSDGPWDEIEHGARERLQALPQTRDLRFPDLVLQIASPPGCRSYRGYEKPSIIYTQHALGELPPQWIERLRGADGIIVPSEFDRKVFARHFDPVFVAAQSSDPALFYPRPELRASGPARFTFLFVGRYGFRKGIDLLIEAFCREFSPHEPVGLTLNCPSLGPEQRRHCEELLAHTQPSAPVQLRASELVPESMNRLYNESDCVITLSRGEGWCMPLSEALLCEVPVIAPHSTGMREYLDESVAELVETSPHPAIDAPGSFGRPFAAAYGFAGVTYDEPDVAQARAAMRRVYENHGAAREKARAGRGRILERFSWENAVRDVEAACRAVVLSAPSGW